MKFEYLHPFTNSLKKTFDSQIKIPLEILERQIVTSKQFLAEKYEIIGIMELKGKVSGHIILAFSEDLALEVANRFAGISSKSINSEVSDAIGELTNIIGGNAKNELHNLGLVISIPQVIVGKTKNFPIEKKDKFILVNYKTLKGKLALALNLK